MCSNCDNSGSNCVYIARAPPPTIRRKRHVKALETRIAVLESYLIKHGLPNVGEDIIDPTEVPITTSDRQSDKEGLFPGSHQTSTRQQHETVKEEGSMIDVLRELSLEASGGYIGASSTITLGQMVCSILKDEPAVREKTRMAQDEHDHLLSLGDPKPDDNLSEMDHSLLQDDVVDKLVHGFLKYVTHRLPIMFTPGVWRKHSRRFELQNPYQRATLYMVYALGAKALENAGDGRNFSTEAYYQAAVDQLEEVLEYNDIRSVTLLLLLALYCLGDPRSPGAWQVASSTHALKC